MDKISTIIDGIWDNFKCEEQDPYDLTTNVAVNIVYMDNYDGGPDNKKLEYAHYGDSGFDFRAAKSVRLAPGDTAIVPTGIRMAIPRGLELQVRTRSGSPVKKGFIVANSPGTIDSGYRGEIGIIVTNISRNVTFIKQGERVAQGVLCPVFKCMFREVKCLDDTERGEGAYNSTGTK